MKKYVSTTTLCMIYEVESMFFLRRKKEGVFTEGEHYIQQSNTLRWDFELIESWWRNDNVINNINDILDRVL